MLTQVLYLQSCCTVLAHISNGSTTCEGDIYRHDSIFVSEGSELINLRYFPLIECAEPCRLSK